MIPKLGDILDQNWALIWLWFGKGRLGFLTFKELRGPKEILGSTKVQQC
jgi:hypothetical protein